MTKPHPLLEHLPSVGERIDDADVVMDRFVDYVSNLGIELYPAQEEALLEILADHNVILNTPTGSGKSLVALAMHFKAMCEDKRSVYTSPVKALVNEKFFALCEAFHPDNVGLVTGDATVNAGAPIVCCTAEILANQALRQGAQLDLQYAVLDEFHYYGDRDRGVAWQIPLLTLPQTRLLLMSATLGDMTLFERALTELNGCPTVTVSSDERPVPLSFDYFEIPLHETVARLIDRDAAPIYLVNFTQKGCHTEAQNLMSVNVASKETKKAIAEQLRGYRFDTPYGKTLQRFVRHGIGIHHGGMLPKYRRLVERLAKQGLLKVISGTDTLGVGVNIPIRSVVLTKLCKFDGSETRILSVRDFKQICGRAGRKGYDERGHVIVQAPEHVVANLRLEAKASGDPKKKRKLVKKKPPTRGYVNWTRATFDKLVTGKPEPLASSFAVSHSMLLNVLSREQGGCRAMKQLIRSCHDRKADRRRHAKTAIQMFRSLVEAEIMSLVDQPGRIAKRVQVNVDLQREFSLHYALSLYVVETTRQLELDYDSYPLDVLSLVEAVLDDPHVVLRKQLDRIKGTAVAEMKAAGIEYDERMEELEKLDYPKPNAEFIYATFNEFAVKHPWVGERNIRPKGVAREMYECAYDFRGYVTDYKLERSEGSVLRYMTDAYKALVQLVPMRARTHEVEDLIEYFGGVVRGVDASLIDEWEQLRNPKHVLTKPAPEPEVVSRGITANLRSFTVLLRNALFRVVRALSSRNYEAAAAAVDSPSDAEPWSSEAIEQALADYWQEHASIRVDPRARATQHTLIEQQDRHWRVRQVLVDDEDHNDWYLDIAVDLDRSDETESPVLVLHGISS